MSEKDIEWNGEIHRCYLDHVAYAQGYVSKEEKRGIMRPYKGRYGSGFVIDYHNELSTRYVIREYWIEVENDG